MKYIRVWIYLKDPTLKRVDEKLLIEVVESTLSQEDVAKMWEYIQNMITKTDRVIHKIEVDVEEDEVGKNEHKTQNTIFHADASEDIIEVLGKKYKIHPSCLEIFMRVLDLDESGKPKKDSDGSLKTKIISENITSIDIWNSCKDK